VRQAYGVGGEQVFTGEWRAHGSKLAQRENFSVQTWARLAEENGGAEA